jgi:ankyrin repeat protein
VRANTRGMAEQTPDLGLARDEALARLWRAAAQGLPIPTECFAHSPSSEFVHKLQYVAAWNNHGPTAVALSEQTPDDDEQGKAWVLAGAVLHGSVDAAAALIAAGINVHTEVDLGGGKALHWAVRGGHVSAVAFLINAKAHVVFPGGERVSPIHRLAKGGHEVVEMLLSAKADVHRVDEWGDTAIHSAAASGDTAIVSRLLQVKANVNATDDAGDTALHWGARDAAIVRLLLAAKANVEAVNNYDYQALHYAALGTQVLAAARLVRARADVHALGQGGRTPLHLAVSIGKKVGLVAYLIAAKSDAHRGDRHGQTPLSAALQDDAAGPIIQVLVAAKARVDA